MKGAAEKRGGAMGKRGGKRVGLIEGVGGWVVDEMKVTQSIISCG